jgi:hypothetical protein
MATLDGVNENHLQISTRSWRLLSDFIFDRCDDLIKEDERQGWHSTRGKIISCETAVAIADRLEALMDQGVVERFRTELSIVHMDTHFSEYLLKTFIEFCRHSGGFDIW